MLDDPERLRRFVSFVNAPGTPDPSIAFVSERGQPRPADLPVPGLPPARAGGGPMTGTWRAALDGGVPLRRPAAGARRRGADRPRCRWRCSAPSTARVHAIGNQDPFTGAFVLSRGIVGGRGEIPTVASPLHKQVFDLRTGACLDDDSVARAGL